jgi:hypothetical protein
MKTEIEFTQHQTSTYEVTSRLELEPHECLNNMNRVKIVIGARRELSDPRPAASVYWISFGQPTLLGWKRIQRAVNDAFEAFDSQYGPGDQ